MKPGSSVSQREVLRVINGSAASAAENVMLTSPAVFGAAPREATPASSNAIFVGRLVEIGLTCLPVNVRAHSVM